MSWVMRKSDLSQRCQHVVQILASYERGRQGKQQVVGQKKVTDSLMMMISNVETSKENHLSKQDIIPFQD